MPVLHAGVLTVRACRMSDERRNISHIRMNYVYYMWYNDLKKIESSNLCFAKYLILFTVYLKHMLALCLPRAACVRRDPTRKNKKLLSQLLCKYTNSVPISAYLRAG